MSHFATFSYPDRDGHVTVRVNSDGTVHVVVHSSSGELVDERDEEIDVRDARRLITDFFSVATQLTGRNDGPMRLVIGEGDEQRAHYLSEYDLPFRGLESVRVMKTIATDVLSGYDARSARRHGGPRVKRMTALAFLGWSFAFGFGYLAANIIGTLARIVGAFAGPFSFAVGNSLAIFLMWGCYYKVGQMFGEEYRGRANVFLPAIAGTIPFVYLYATFGGAATVFSVVFAIAMPFIAYRGEQTGH